MKRIFVNETTEVIRFDKDEEVFSRLLEYCAEQQILAATFTIIGSVSEATLAYYDLKNKSFEDLDIVEDLEVAGVIGNIAALEGKPVVHAHGTFAKRDLSIIGGHIKKITVSAMCEVVLTKLTGPLNRQLNEDIGLNALA